MDGCTADGPPIAPARARVDQGAIAVAPRFGSFDIPVMLGVTLGFAFLLLAHLGVRRLTAGAMLFAYVGYTVALVQV